MSDRIFDVRVMTDFGETFEGATLTVPARLRPDDLDWKQSRPAFGWDLAPMYDWRNDFRVIISLELPYEYVRRIWLTGPGHPEGLN